MREEKNYLRVVIKIYSDRLNLARIKTKEIGWESQRFQEKMGASLKINQKHSTLQQ